MALSVSQLRTPVTTDQALATLLSYLASAGFQVAGWGEGSVHLTLLRAFASLYARLTTYVAALVSWGFNDLATEDGLTKFAKSHYENERFPARKAQHRLTIACAAGVGPYTIETGRLLVEGDDVYFVSIEPVYIAKGGAAQVVVEAQEAGAAGNVDEDGITTMVSSWAGLSVTASTRTRAGADEESDAALRVRNSTKWATISVENTIDSIANTAMNAADPITRVVIDDSNPRGVGTVDVYVAGETYTVGSEDLADAETAVWARFFDPDPRVQVLHATPVELAISGTITYAGAELADVRAAVEAALLELLSVTPTGDSDPTRTLAIGDIYEAIEGAAGVVSSSLNPGTSVPIPRWSFLVPPDHWLFAYVEAES